MNARDTYQLLQLQPGVQGNRRQRSLFSGGSQSGAVSVNGGRGRANNFSVNGGDANDHFINAPTIQPSPDTIRNSASLPTRFDAEYGRNSGAVVNVVTKSGTNQFHGDIYEYFRNTVLNAQGYLTPSSRIEPEPVWRHFRRPGQQGSALFSLCLTKAAAPVEGVTADPVVVPSQAELGGDFSAPRSAGPSPAQRCWQFAESQRLSTANRQRRWISLPSPIDPN